MRHWWAAAAILVMLTTGAYVWFASFQKELPIVTNPSPTHKVVPGSNRAVLTLADGKQIILDNANTGLLAQQGSATITKLDSGKVAYSAENANPAQLVYNTLATPRGGQYQLVLPDGSKVWLDAASWIRYPTSFTPSERRVEISGQAYFEIAHRDNLPFIITVNGTEVRDIGTAFNINGYRDEKVLDVTLVEGSVEVRKNTSKLVLTPNQQARVVQEKLELVKNAPIEEVVAWKNGKFMFGEKADIATIMRQVARWYDVEVEYRGEVNVHFGGSISRQENVSRLLQKLELTGNVKFILEGKKIIVMP